MRRTVVAEEKILPEIVKLGKTDGYIPGLIIGQRPRPRQRPAARGQFNIKNNVTTRTKRLRPRRGHLAAATRIFCLGRRGHMFLRGQ
ncbi:hypothetical protein J6590_007910 [Homalodisca vitripennis]|nr:hypothetical protein J6590_007910 [Homalodisca vitripennis]